MADTYTEGYRIGFETTGKDLSKKTTAQVRYPIGFERMVRAAVHNLEKMGLEVTMLASGTAANKQYDYDHRRTVHTILTRRTWSADSRRGKTHLRKKKYMRTAWRVRR